MTDSLSIVIPVYRSEQSLPVLMERLNGLLPTLSSQVEVILVNDGSPDNTAQVLDRECARYPWAKAVHLMRNYGQHNALLCGIRQARYQTILTMDDDLQNPPEYIPTLLAKLNEGYDVVYGYPETESHGFLRDLASRITKLTLQSAMGVATANRVSSFRAFREQVREGFCDYRGSFVSIDVLLSWSTARFSAVPVPNPPRTLGESTYTLRKLIAHAMNMMTGFSTLPLQLASILGFVFAFFGFLVLIWVLGRYLLQGGSVPGFPFLASVLSIFSGVQLFSLGIIGEYLARMHSRTMDRPTYTIRSITGAPHAATVQRS
jgi:undecaprenyl-phosphate 4-deoxy-4-formamido-L-arabinose transferase